MESKLQYQRADFSNYKKRVARDMMRHVEFATEDLILDILDPVDDFERAVATLMKNRENNSKTALDGLHASLKKLLSVLASHGVEPFNSIGDPFDPNRHDALAMVRVNGIKPGTVIEEVKRGYTMKGKVLRPAIVKVTEDVKETVAEGTITQNESEPENAKDT